MHEHSAYAVCTIQTITRTYFKLAWTQRWSKQFHSIFMIITFLFVWGFGWCHSTSWKTDLTFVFNALFYETIVNFISFTCCRQLIDKENIWLKEKIKMVYPPIFRFHYSLDHREPNTCLEDIKEIYFQLFQMKFSLKKKKMMEISQGQALAILSVNALILDSRMNSWCDLVDTQSVVNRFVKSIISIGSVQ